MLEPIASGRDVVCRAKTGSGKTLAFALPVVENLLEVSGLRRPRVGVGRKAGGTWARHGKGKIWQQDGGSRLRGLDLGSATERVPAHVNSMRGWLCSYAGGPQDAAAQGPVAALCGAGAHPRAGQPGTPCVCPPGDGRHLRLTLGFQAPKLHCVQLSSTSYAAHPPNPTSPPLHT